MIRQSHSRVRVVEWSLDRLGIRFGFHLLVVAAFLILFFLALPPAMGAEEAAAPTVETLLQEAKVSRDTVFTLFCGFLVMFMALGFALLESGLCRAKNTANIISKNFVVFAITSLVFLIVGFGFMFGSDGGHGFIGTDGILFLSGQDNSPATGDGYLGAYTSLNWAGIPLEAKFFFQMVFAATAATIISGAVAERIRFVSFCLFSLLIGAVLYPIVGHWIWGGGWLSEKGMFDFAGSTVVHSVGGWAALAGALLVGPRIGKYAKNGRVNPIPGHSLTSAAIGVFVLWFGWFGFNPGSAMAADYGTISHVAVTTNTAAAAGALGATFLAWILLKKPDLSMALNGGVAGLVAITAPCAMVSLGSSIVIGLVAGVAVVLAVLFFDKIRVDDPVGAISVHLVCGIWGTLALGLFGDKRIFPDLVSDGLLLGGGAGQFLVQLTGVLAVGGFIFVGSLVGWAFLKAIVGIRVSPDAELAGLDLREHGNVAYPNFLYREGGGAAVSSFPETIPESLPKREAPAPVPAVTASSLRKPPSVRHEPPPSRKPPVYKSSSTLGMRGRANGNKEFEVTFPDMDKRFLAELWRDLCEKFNRNPTSVPDEFADIYPKVNNFTGNTLVFRDGIPEEFCQKLEKILESYGVEGARVQVS